MTKDELLKETIEIDKFFSLWNKQSTNKQNALIYFELRKLNENIEKLVNDKPVEENKTTTKKTTSK